MKKFENEAMFDGNPMYEICTARIKKLYNRKNDFRDVFTRDYTRLIFSQGNRRLKSKTQVFFSPSNDHICTRAEHVSLVESVSSTIASELGLNINLTKAIATGHDIGHPPFGHGGEKIISKLSKEYGLENFHHEINSLFFIDNIETIEDEKQKCVNLNLSYAVRDGIVCHCGELKQKSIYKRNEYIDLYDYTIPGQFEPFTWEGCVVKISDKIAYLARDIEDALTLKIINESDVEVLVYTINKIDKNYSFKYINNGTLINYFITDVCMNSSLDNGISLSDTAFKVMNEIMAFNYKKIYLIDRVKIHHEYVSLMINSIFNQLDSYYKNVEIDNRLIYNLEHDRVLYPILIETFSNWLIKYTEILVKRRSLKFTNNIVFNYTDHDDYRRAILFYISGMTDSFIVSLFDELLKI